jgi:hypothetical protein
LLQIGRNWIKTGRKLVEIFRTWFKTFEKCWKLVKNMQTASKFIKGRSKDGQNWSWQIRKKWPNLIRN